MGSGVSKIVIGEASGRNASIDLDVLLRTRLLIQANSGKGKSWLLRRLAEQLFGKVQVLIIDPEGEFATLREKLDFVLVGKGGETAAHPRIAAMTAQRLLELRACAVCDLYEMKPSERHAYVRAFLEALIDAPKNLWHPLVVIVDEAHVYCPEKGAGESEASEAVIGMATRGRKRGYCLVAATQRLGKFRKDAASELLNVGIGGTFIDIDRKRAADALGVYGQDVHPFFDEIRLLERGKFYFLGPAISTERILVSIGEVQTTHPEAGSARHAAEPPPTPQKIKALLPSLADLPKEAEEKARNIADLQKQVRELKSELSKRPTEVKRIVEEKIVEVPVLRPDQIQELSNIATQIKGVGEIIATALASVRKAPAVSPLRPVRNTVQPISKAKQIVKSNVESDGTLSKGEKAVLTAIAQDGSGVDRNQLTVLTGYKRSTRDAYLQRLATKGFIHENGTGINPTEEGLQALGDDYEPLPTGKELRDYWMERLPEGERKILEFLVAAWPEPVQRDLISDQTGYARSSRDAYLQRLASRRLVDTSGRAEVVASHMLFDDGVSA